MKLSKLIKKLQVTLKAEGDLEVKFVPALQAASESLDVGVRVDQGMDICEKGGRHPFKHVTMVVAL